MGRRSKAAAKRRMKKKLISFVLAIVIALIGAAIYMLTNKEDTPPEEPVYEIPTGSVEYHFIDIGQGDAELILVDGKAILIDTGVSAEKENLSKYLADHNVTELEYFIATHPDADHIGSAAYVVENYPIKNIIISPKTHTTKTYENFIAAIEAKPDINLYIAGDPSSAEKDWSFGADEINLPIDSKFNVGELEFTVLGPVDQGDYSKGDNNNPSVVLMARWGNTKVLLTGDAEKEAELKLVEKYGTALNCDVLKAGHHGSHSSTFQADPENGIMNGFLHYTTPSMAIISCETGNDYGHPHKETIDYLTAENVEILRTDLLGSIVLVSDGTTITRKTA